MEKRRLVVGEPRSNRCILISLPPAPQLGLWRLHVFHYFGGESTRRTGCSPLPCSLVCSLIRTGTLGRGTLSLVVEPGHWGMGTGDCSSVRISTERLNAIAGGLDG